MPRPATLRGPMSSNQCGAPVKVGLVDRRAVRLDRDDRLDQLRPRVGDRPGEGARLRMRQQHGGADPIEQRDAGVAIDLLLLAVVDQRGKLRGVERIEHGVAGSRRVPGHWRVRRACGQSLKRAGATKRCSVRNRFDIGDRALRLRPVRGAAARHLVDHIDRVPAAQEILRPAFAAVGRAGEVGAGLAAAVDHHDRVGRAQPLRDEVFRVHLARPSARP